MKVSENVNDEEPQVKMSIFIIGKKKNRGKKSSNTSQTDVGKKGEKKGLFAIKRRLKQQLSTLEVERNDEEKINNNNSFQRFLLQ